MVHYLQQANYIPALRLNHSLKMNLVVCDSGRTNATRSYAGISQIKLRIFMDCSRVGLAILDFSNRSRITHLKLHLENIA